MKDVTNKDKFGNNSKNKINSHNSINLSKKSSKFSSSKQDLKNWKKETLERFLFHLKKIKESNKLHFNSPNKKK
jgi:hypothetical protein